MGLFKVTLLLIFLFVNPSYNKPVDDMGSNEIIDGDYSIDANISTKDLIKLLLKWKYDPTKLGMDPDDRIKSFGYPAEKHLVTTEDGYILTVNRIPYGKYSTDKINRPAVILQPGLMCTPGCYVDIGPGHSLAYLLADIGFDVWLGAVRGTTFSRNHTTLNSMKDKKYWDYSWHEVGTRDIPAVIDHILETTGHKKISYIGHSQGTTAFFVMASERPEYNDKINVMIALAPVAYMEHMSKTALMYKLAKRRKEIFLALKLAGIHDVFPHYDPITENVQKICNDNVTDWSKCKSFWEMFGGTYDPEMFDLRNVYILSAHMPGGASVKQFAHYAQLIDAGGFNKYDHGKRKNLKIYGQPEPPAYNLSNIKTVVYLMYGDNDGFTPIQDIKRLHAELPSSQLFRVNYDMFGHGDFLYAKKVITLVYNYVFEILMRHSYLE